MVHCWTVSPTIGTERDLNIYVTEPEGIPDAVQTVLPGNEATCTLAQAATPSGVLRAE